MIQIVFFSKCMLNFPVLISIEEHCCVCVCVFVYVCLSVDVLCLSMNESVFVRECFNVHG